MIDNDPEDLPVEVVSAYGPFALIPEALINSTVSDAALRLYAVFALHSDRKTATTFVGYRAIAERLGKSKRSLMRACAELVEVGAISVTARTVGGRRTSNLYTLLAMTPPGDRNVTTPGDRSGTTVGDTNGTTVTRTKATRTKGTKVSSSAELDDAKRIAAAIYDRDKLINFVAVMKLAEKALKAGEPPQRVESALLMLVDAGRPISGETLRLQIGRLKRPSTRDNPWEVQ